MNDGLAKLDTRYMDTITRLPKPTLTVPLAGLGVLCTLTAIAVTAALTFAGPVLMMLVWLVL